MKRALLNIACHIVFFCTIVALCNSIVKRAGIPTNTSDSWRADHKDQQYDVVVVSNSMAERNIDNDYLSKLTQKTVLKGTESGTSSAWWYLFIKNLAMKMQEPPKTVLLFFRANDVTSPTHSVRGNNEILQLQISENQEPLMEELVYKPTYGRIGYYLFKYLHVYRGREQLRQFLYTRTRDFLYSSLTGKTKGAERMLNTVLARSHMNMLLADKWEQANANPRSVKDIDIDEAIRTSFLPHIINEVHAKGSDLILIRVKQRKFITMKENKSELLYFEGLRKYLEENDVIFLDYTKNPLLQEEHYSDGDHLSPSGIKLFTEIVAKDVNRILKGFDESSI